MWNRVSRVSNCDQAIDGTPAGGAQIETPQRDDLLIQARAIRREWQLDRVGFVTIRN